MKLRSVIIAALGTPAFSVNRGRSRLMYAAANTLPVELQTSGGFGFDPGSAGSFVHFVMTAIAPASIPTVRAYPR